MGGGSKSSRVVGRSDGTIIREAVNDANKLIVTMREGEDSRRRTEAGEIFSNSDGTFTARPRNGGSAKNFDNVGRANDYILASTYGEVLPGIVVGNASFAASDVGPSFRGNVYRTSAGYHVGVAKRPTTDGKTETTLFLLRGTNQRGTTVAMRKDFGPTNILGRVAVDRRNSYKLHIQYATQGLPGQTTGQLGRVMDGRGRSAGSRGNQAMTRITGARQALLRGRHGGANEVRRSTFNRDGRNVTIKGASKAMSNAVRVAAVKAAGGGRTGPLFRTLNARFSSSTYSERANGTAPLNRGARRAQPRRGRGTQAEPTRPPRSADRRGGSGPLKRRNNKKKKDQ